MTGILDYLSAFGQSILYYFDVICLIVGIILLSVNVIKMDQEKNKTENTDLYKNLNISALAFFGVFVIYHFIAPFLKRS
jgi:hypothetical protein